MTIGGDPLTGSAAASQNGIVARLLVAIGDSSIGQFAFVMATGIISTALWLDGVTLLSTVMLLTAALGYILLCLGHGIRAVRFRARVLAEFGSDRGMVYLAFVAASNVLSARLSIGQHHDWALVLLAIGGVGWIVLGYGVPLAMISRLRRESSGLTAVNGTWFMWIVGTQSVSVAALAAVSDRPAHTPLDSTLVVVGGLCWAVGLMQYLLIASIVSARLLLHRITPGTPVAPYWVFMGSAAITILAGALLLAHHRPAHLLTPAVVSTLSMALWSFATWLIPLLLALVLWHTLRSDGRVDYRTEWWAGVFPIGMYGVASHLLGNTEHARWLAGLGMVGAWVALAVWLLVVMMLGVKLARRSDDHPARTA